MNLTRADNPNSEQSALAIKYFLDHFSTELLFDKNKFQNKNEELAHFYLEKLSEVFSVFDRLIRYEKYFKDFLPSASSGISESEAIEYHMRSYIGDFYILQERIRKITNKLIEDLPNYNIANQKEIEEVVKHLSNQTSSKFSKITSGLRREHVHERSITELDLITGKFLSSLVSGEITIPTEINLDIEKVKNRRDEVVTSMKNKHIGQASKNSDSLRKMKEWFAARFIYIFASLNGHTIDGIKM
ncbi:MAG: hypothetical protein Q7K38_00280 [Candidatus Wildermuthbacteria bacterium]|nr:hypothetical protein [Candidatus Wildermuthbacteria bacterium]